MKHLFNEMKYKTVYFLFSPKRDPSDNAVPERKQPAQDSGDAAGGDHGVSKHCGQYRELRGGH